MSIKTKIQWCDSTVNPTMGCDGCELWGAHPAVLLCRDSPRPLRQDVLWVMRPRLRKSPSSPAGSPKPPAGPTWRARSGRTSPGWTAYPA